MQLELGRRADYAIRVVLELSRQQGRGRRKAREIGAQVDVPRAYLAQILARLVESGLVLSRAGPAGGYELAGRPADLDLLSVVEAVDGTLRSTECVMRGIACQEDGTCVVHEPWSRAQEALRARLAATTFADLADPPTLTAAAAR